jgi:hypothetical protein
MANTNISDNTGAASITGPHGAFTLRAESFQPYVESLRFLLIAYDPASAADSARIVAALDGQPGRELRNRYPAHLLRITGTFFTGSQLASQLPDILSLEEGNRLIVDPACGAGDLLVAFAKRLPMRSDLRTTITEWGTQLAGFDLNDAFIRAAQYRLCLLAISRGAKPEHLHPLEVAQMLPHIRVQDGQEPWGLGKHATAVVINPPFSHVVAPSDCKWASGRVSQAALFVENCLAQASPPARILAILPDVLRTGARYRLWRKHIEAMARINAVTIVGQFDELTDVSVFLLSLSADGARARHSNWGMPKKHAGTSVNDLFDIHVGAVVPFRQDGSGPWRPYAHADVLPAWNTVRSLPGKTRFPGTTFTPPLVLVRRTSKATSKNRCIATIVTGKDSIAVENHFLVAVPKDNLLRTCRKLLELLRRPSASIWMNRCIRCRHLTVGALGGIPWEES